MLIRKAAGVVILVHAAFVAFQVVMNFDSLKQSSEAFAAPKDPFWFLWGIVGLNAFVVIAAGILGAYFIRANELKFKYVLPLSLVAALYGGYSLAIGIGALVIGVFQRHRENAI